MKIISILFLFVSISAFADASKFQCQSVNGTYDTDPNGVDKIQLETNNNCKIMDISCINKISVNLYSNRYTLNFLGLSVHTKTVMNYSSEDKKFQGALILDLIPNNVNPEDASAKRFNGKEFEALFVFQQYYVNFPITETMTLHCELE